MRIHGLLFVVMLGAIVGFLSWGVVECQDSAKWKRTAQYVRQQGKAEVAVVMAELRKSQESDNKHIGLLMKADMALTTIKQKAFSFEQQVKMLVANRDKLTDKLTNAEKQKRVVDNYKANGTLPPNYLPRKDGVAIQDTAILDASVKTSEREKVKDQRIRDVEQSLAASITEAEGLRKSESKAKTTANRAIFVAIKAVGGLRKVSQKSAVGRLLSGGPSRRKEAKQIVAEVEPTLESELNPREGQN